MLSWRDRLAGLTAVFGKDALDALWVGG